MRWYGQVKRMGKESAITHVAMAPDNYQIKRMAKKQWMDNIFDVLEYRETSLEEVEEKKLYMDRDMWKGYLTDRPKV